MGGDRRSLFCLQNAPAHSRAAACHGYMRIRKAKKRSIKWKKRYLALYGSKVYVFDSRFDATRLHNLRDEWTLLRGEVAQSCVSSARKPDANNANVSLHLCLKFTTTSGIEYLARAEGRADYAKWITACYQLSWQESELYDSSHHTGISLQARGEAKEILNQECSSVEASTDQEIDGLETPLARKDGVILGGKTSRVKANRHVSFMDNVSVLEISPIEERFHPDVYYSCKEVEKFMNHKRSLFSRTEEAMSYAYFSLKEKKSSFSNREKDTCR
uniref:AlNc14C137G7114 protein n=1 Tax=Albugo laibachii Nc14 TaxID=890382 RepID=F0WKS4_9STRA|nr:AlNc14C137G7114 [Albugo laibachii Nc14]|eukprot:CCA21881.1 AlNc14C137G7114 [Albugo laibachii Nc14]